jgi:hypothetical protein
MIDRESLAACLSTGASPDEWKSALWTALADWAWSYDPDDIPDAESMTADQAAELLDDARRQVPGLDSADGWRSAARYFQAENFHGFVVPCCERALQLET